MTQALTILKCLESHCGGMSRPCKHCQQLLYDFGITDIWYTNKQGEFTQQ